MRSSKCEVANTVPTGTAITLTRNIKPSIFEDLRNRNDNGDSMTIVEAKHNNAVSSLSPFRASMIMMLDGLNIAIANMITRNTSMFTFPPIFCSRLPDTFTIASEVKMGTKRDP
jgi:hypothetical protein